MPLLFVSETESEAHAILVVVRMERRGGGGRKNGICTTTATGRVPKRVKRGMCETVKRRFPLFVLARRARGAIIPLKP